MAEKKPVTVNWQSLFIIIPIIDLWAAYRVEKFRIYFLVFWVGLTILETLVGMAMLGDRYWSDDGGFFSSDQTLASIQIVIFLVTIGVKIYFIRIWSKKWNAKIAENS